MTKQNFYHNTPLNIYNNNLYIVEFPKSGITWFSHILINVFLLKSKSSFQASFFNLEMFIGDIHKSKDILKIDELPFRIIKSHDTFNPHYRHVIYLLRNPFDVMKSYYNFSKNTTNYNKSFNEFIRDSNLGIQNYIKHVESWLKLSKSLKLHLIKYEELRKDTFSIITLFLKIIGFNCEEEIIKQAINISDIKKMRENNELYKENCPNLKYTFVGEGKIDNYIENIEDEKYIFDNSFEILKLYYPSIYEEKSKLFQRD